MAKAGRSSTPKSLLDIPASQLHKLHKHKSTAEEREQLDEALRDFAARVQGDLDWEGQPRDELLLPRPDAQTIEGTVVVDQPGLAAVDAKKWIEDTFKAWQADGKVPPPGRGAIKRLGDAMAKQMAADHAARKVTQALKSKTIQNRLRDYKLWPPSAR